MTTEQQPKIQGFPKARAFEDAVRFWLAYSALLLLTLLGLLLIGP